VLDVHAEPTGESLEATYCWTRAFLEAEEAPIVIDARDVVRFAMKDILS
jgi:hypothetical protein